MNQRPTAHNSAILLLRAVGNGVLIAALAWMMASWSWQLIWQPRDSAPKAALPRPSDQSASSQIPLSDPDLQAWMGLFGVSNRTVTAVSQRTAPETLTTTLDARLLGILSASDNSVLPRAILVGREIPERAYGVGDRIGPAWIQRIEWDHVLLDHQGRLESVRLPKFSSLDGQETNQKKIAPETQELVGKLWSQFETTPESILEKIRIEPYFDRGQLQGVRLFPGSDPKFLEPFGIRGGDLVTWVNGVELNDPAKGMELLGKLGSADAIQFRVLRGSETLAFEFHRK